jgi:hypothetical protein
MIGYALLVLITGFVVIVGSIVVGVAIWGWQQEKKVGGVHTRAAPARGAHAHIAKEVALKEDC